MRFHLLVIALTGCAQVPPGLAYPNESETRALAAAVVAWPREWTECGDLDRAMITTLDHDELQDWCGASVEVDACTDSIVRYAWEPSRSMILVSDRLDARGHAAAVIHEAYHTLRSCWVWADRNQVAGRLNTGESDECQIRWPADHRHCDGEIWGPTVADALLIWEQ